MNIKKLSEELGIKPSKKLGQNFLTEKNATKKILEWADFPKNSNVVEIGPGLGALTFDLVEQGHNVFLIEKDKKLFEYLRSKLPSSVDLAHGDVLDFPFSSVFPEQNFFLISNAPYSISTPIVEKALDHQDRISQMVFLFQEEVVDRICAQSGNKNYGRLAIWVQSQCDIEKGPRISRENFFPKPDVESRLVRLSPSKSPLIPPQRREEFLKWVGRIFQQRRKTLRKNLKDMGFESTRIDQAIQSSSLDPQVRAEDIDLSTLFSIFTNL